MKIGIIGDIHFCEYSSILRTRGEEFSTRLENCIESINWAEETTADCDCVIYLGDFFDKSSLNAAELSALRKIIWNDKYHYFLVGNHEMGIYDLSQSSSHILGFNSDNIKIVDKPYMERDDKENIQLAFLPYILESEKMDSIHDYFIDNADKKIIFSHNDLCGVQMGPIISKVGFDLKDIENNCELFFNGHLHNSAIISDKIINIGNLTGQNFSEDAFKYEHHIAILDTHTMTYDFKVNPYAVNFYKLDKISDIDKVHNAVVTLKIFDNQIEEAKNKIEDRSKILASKLIIDRAQTATKAENVKLVSIDHLEEFKKFVLKNMGDAPFVEEELSIING